MTATGEFHDNKKLGIPMMGPPKTDNLRVRFNFESSGYWDLKEGSLLGFAGREHINLLLNGILSLLHGVETGWKGYWGLKEEILGLEGRIIGI